jgi:membrane-associated protease RseP (regulator of RpoE activity)
MKAQDVWIPLVDEPIGSIVQEIQDATPEIAELVVGPKRTLAFRTFAYIRVGMLLGQLLLETDVAGGDETWVEALLRDPANHDAVVREVLSVAEEVAADSSLGGDEALGPDDEARERFREFARKQLG